MSYVYGPTVTIEVLPPELIVSKVSIVPDKTRVRVGELVNFIVRADLNRATEAYDPNYFSGVELVIAVNEQANIVASALVPIEGAGVTYVATALTYAFPQPGKYVVWGGARVVPKVTGYGYIHYLISRPKVIEVCDEVCVEGYPTPSIVGDLALLALGAVAGAYGYKLYREGKLRLPRLR